MNALKTWLSKIGQRGGKSTSEAKKAAARQNGKLAALRRNKGTNTASTAGTVHGKGTEVSKRLLAVDGSRKPIRLRKTVREGQNG